MKLVFGIMSAVQSAATVNQLVESLAPHRVVIHHDFGQQPNFVIDQPNVSFVPNPKRTGWAVWGFTEGVFHTLAHAVEQENCDYFQLLSPTCLPIRPVSEFHAAMQSSEADVQVDVLDLSRDQDALMNFGYRAFAARETLKFRLLRRCALNYYGYEWFSERRANLQLRVAGESASRPTARLCLAITRLAQHGWLGPHLYTKRFRPLVGGSWFGARRQACQHLLDSFRDPEINEFFSNVHIADEVMIATLFGNSRFRLGPSNHFVNQFTAGNPNWLNTRDLQLLKGCGKFFARKFPDDPMDPARQAVLARIRPQVTAGIN